ncbi:MAG: L-lactate permease [Alkalibacterium sp.]|nr:L-lactate permease [Alkalibacterium sp.]MDN6327569.1 L-lactate permease [Alkalibacterium sp.]
MNIPISFFTWIVAALPIIVLLVMMLRFQWGAEKAAPLGLIIAFISGMAVFDASFQLVFLEALKGVWSAITVLIIVWTAILLYEVVNEANAFEVFRVEMKKISPNELLQVLIFGWVFISFLMGITGFGVPVAIGAPLLVGIGVSPIWAVFIPLIGHAWGNTFGTLAVAWDALVLQTNIGDNSELLLSTALWAAIFIWIWNFISGIAICWVYGKKEAVKKGLLAVIIISTIQGGGQLILSQFNQTIAAFIPATIALIVALFLGKTKTYGNPWRMQGSKIMDRENNVQDDEDYPDMKLSQAFVPYFILSAITLFVLLIQPVKNYLGQVSVGFPFPETSTGYGFVNEAAEKFSPLAPFTHASLFLALASLLGFLYYKKNGWIHKGAGKIVIKLSLEKTIPSGVAVLGFIVMSRLMGGTGQTVVLAEGISKIMQEWYVLFAPMVGVLGSFMTSSNMASNVLFGDFQLATAKILELDPSVLLGAHTAGGTIGNTISPGNIILGTTTAGILGKEGIILKKILPLALFTALFIGLIVFTVLIIV